MKFTLEVDTEPHLTAQEIEDYRKLCQHVEISAEAGIARLIRSEVEKFKKSLQKSRKPAKQKVQHRLGKEVRA